MDFRFSEQQEILRKSARDFLVNECPGTLVRDMIEDEKGYSPESWHKMAELGWMGLYFPEEYGGSGASFIDLMVLCEEMGRACMPGPYFSTVALGGMTVLEAGSEGQKREFLTSVSNGSQLLTLALTEASAKYTPEAIRVKAINSEEGYTIQGTKLFVTDAQVADWIICVARTGDADTDISLFIVDAKAKGLNIVLLKTSAGDKQCEVNFDKVFVPKRNILGEVNKAWWYISKVLSKATVCKCTEMLGGAQKVVEMAVDHAKQRIQFECPIGSFQAIQHHCANMVIALDSSRFLTYEAGWRLENGLPADVEVAAAKSWTSECYRRITLLGHQVLGGVGVIQDHDMHLYSKRALSSSIFLGSPMFHRQTVAKELGL